MDTERDIDKKIEAALNSADTLQNVNVSPFFKEKTMQRLFNKEEKVATLWSWFTPNMQLAALVCIIVFNILAFSNLKEETYSTDLNEFAVDFGLTEEELEEDLLTYTK